MGLGSWVTGAVLAGLSVSLDRLQAPVAVSYFDQPSPGWSFSTSTTTEAEHFEHEEEELQEEQEQKMGDMLEQQERDREQKKEQQRDSALALLEDPASLSPLRARSACLLRSLSLLTSRPAQLQCPECPVCYESLRPPARILQCASGHLLCGNCAARVEQFICPTCREEFTGRAAAMEQLLARLDCHQAAGVASVA